MAAELGSEAPNNVEMANIGEGDSAEETREPETWRAGIRRLEKKIDTILEVLGRNVPTNFEKAWRRRREREEPEDRAWEKVTLEEAVAGDVPIGGVLGR